MSTPKRCHPERSEPDSFAPFFGLVRTVEGSLVDFSLSAFAVSSFYPHRSQLPAASSAILCRAKSFQGPFPIAFFFHRATTQKNHEHFPYSIFFTDLATTSKCSF